MDLARHAAVLWRFRAVAFGGVAITIALAVLASYQPTWDGGPSLKPRGSESWKAVSSILVTQPGFPEGRVTLPSAELNGVTGAEPTDEKRKDGVEFADPARLAGLADLYSKFLTSDEVLNRTPGRPTSAQIQASPFLSSQGSLVLPVIELTANAGSMDAAYRLNEQVFESLRGVLADEQAANGIDRGKRVEVRVIDAPEATLTSGRSHTASILALLLGVLGTVAVAHLLAAVRDRRIEEEALASLVPWTDEEPDEAPEPPYLAGERDAPVRLHR